jgi:hypothetical protein
MPTKERDGVSTISRVGTLHRKYFRCDGEISKKLT